LLHRGRQLAEEILDAARFQARGHQALDAHITELERQAHLACEDDQLARDVGTRQIVARIRLRVAALLGIA
jgi:hypothetical protein